MPKFLDKLLKLDKQSLETYLNQIHQDKERTDSILNQLTIGILLLNKNNSITWANEAAQSILGMQFISRLINWPISNIIDPEFRNWIQSTLDAKQGIFNEEREILFPKHRHLIVTLRPEQFILLVDITGARSKDREEGDVQRINALVRLAKGVAHELGNPLNSIIIHLRLLSKIGESLPPKEKKKFQETVDVLSHETGRLDRIIKNFLKATRQKPPEFRLGNIQDTIEEALNFLEPELKENKIKVKTDFASNVPDFLFDHDKLHQGFINLIKNAIEAMPKGGALRIGTASREKVCTIVFQDTGEGIAEKDLPYIFEEYYTTKDEGSGLGLAILFNIIREHGGRIEVKSEKGKGTIFVIFLPIRKDKLQLTGR